MKWAKGPRAKNTGGHAGKRSYHFVSGLKLDCKLYDVVCVCLLSYKIVVVSFSCWACHSCRFKYYCCHVSCVAYAIVDM